MTKVPELLIYQACIGVHGGLEIPFRACSHGENTGSSPVGVTSKISDLAPPASRTSNNRQIYRLAQRRTPSRLLATRARSGQQKSPTDRKSTRLNSSH